MAIGEALWAAHPERVDLGHGLASAHNNLGNLLRASGRSAEAKQAFKRSIEIDGGKVVFEQVRAGLRKKLQPLLNVLGWPRRWLNTIKNKFRKT